MLSLDEREVLVAAGGEGEVPSAGHSSACAAEEAGCDREPAAARRSGLGDLRLAILRVVDALPDVSSIASTAARTVLIIRTPSAE